MRTTYCQSTTISKRNAKVIPLSKGKVFSYS